MIPNILISKKLQQDNKELDEQVGKMNAVIRKQENEVLKY